MRLVLALVFLSFSFAAAALEKKENEASENPGYSTQMKEHQACLSGKCKNLVPLCPKSAIDSDSGYANATGNTQSSCAERRALLAHGQPVNNVEPTALASPNTADGSYEIENNKSFGQFYKKHIESVKKKLDGWSGSRLKRLNNKSTYKTKDGSKADRFTSLSEEELVESGRVLLLHKASGGDYSVSRNENWDPSLKYDAENEKSKKWKIGGGDYSVVIQTPPKDLRYPFDPIDRPEWMELEVGYKKSCHGDTGKSNYSDEGNDGEQFTFSQVCVHGGGTYKGGSASAEYGVYANSTGVLTTVGRKVAYDAWFTVAFNSLRKFMGKRAACKIARKSGCRSFILKHVDAKNDMMYDYAYSEESKKEFTYGTNNAVKAYDYISEGLPPSDFAGYESDGNTLGYTKNRQLLGYGKKGPFLKLKTTNSILTKAQIDAGNSPWDVEPWLLTGIIHPFVAPDGSDITKPGIFDEECNIGGYEAYKAHIAHCIDYMYENAVCDPNNIELWGGSSIGGALSTLGVDGIQIGNVTTREEKEVGGRTRFEDTTPRAYWNFASLHSLGGLRNTMLGKEITLDNKGTYWPGEGSFVTSGYLQSAQVGNIIIVEGAGNPDGESRFVQQPYAMLVTNTEPEYLEVRRFNNGTSFSACGLTEMAYKYTTHKVFFSSSGTTDYSEDGSGKIKSCNYGEMKDCYIPPEALANVKIYDPDKDNRPANPDDAS